MNVYQGMCEGCFYPFRILLHKTLARVMTHTTNNHWQRIFVRQTFIKAVTESFSLSLVRNPVNGFEAKSLDNGSAERISRITD